MAPVHEPERDPLAVAGIRFVHDGDPGIELPERLTAQWGGSQVRDLPLTIHHSVGDTSPVGLRPLIEAPIALGDYYLDERQQIAVRSRVSETPGFRPQLLRTASAGYAYSITYADASDSPLLQWGWPRTVLMLALPLRGRGVVVHATGFVLSDGTGVLCPAVSGGGKSTLARMLQDPSLSGVTLLSDDRIAVTDESSSLWIWGTPWHSSAGASHAGDGPLRAVVFVGKGEDPQLSIISPSAALRRLLRTVGLPFWDAAATDFTLGIMDRMVSGLPCFEFTYSPRAGVGARFLDTLQEALVRAS